MFDALSRLSVSGVLSANLLCIWGSGPDDPGPLILDAGVPWELA